MPGYRQPHSYGADQAAAGPALARAPRRVELSLPEPLLRHFAVLDTPDTDTLGVAGGRVLLDAVVRSGALLFVIGADQTLTAAELHLLAEVARASVRVLFVVTPGAGGWEAWRAAGDGRHGGVSVPPPPVTPARGRPHRSTRWPGDRRRRTGPRCWPRCRRWPGPTGFRCTGA